MNDQRNILPSSDYVIVVTPLLRRSMQDRIEFVNGVSDLKREGCSNLGSLLPTDQIVGTGKVVIESAIRERTEIMSE